MSSPEQLLKHFELARRDLLELTTTNRLLSTPRDREQGAAVEIHDESASDVFRMLVHEGLTLRFEEGESLEEQASETHAGKAQEPPASGTRPAKRRTTKNRRKSEGETTDGTDPASADRSAQVNTDTSGPAADNVAGSQPDTQAGSPLDDVLHTALTPEELDRRLQTLIDDSATLMQEQGVNVLYLALGFLRWFEQESPEIPRCAPLLLIPVTLEKGRGGKRFGLTWNEGEIETNLTLKVRLKADFGITLPDVPAADDLSPVTYFQDVRRVIAGQRGWDVLQNDLVLWCFSFSKLLMYRDLDPQNWPADQRLEDRPLLRGLLQDGFPAVEPLCQPDENIDRLFDPAQTRHVIDCDSSQSLVIEEAARGRNLVIQGPPGTGKSQTITNLIAAAVTSGRTILFVAEKMAALEVVKRRLDNIGIGDLCLELHSKMSNKKLVLQEIDRTLKLGSPKIPVEFPDTLRRLKDRQQFLNRFADMMHTPFADSGMTPYQVLGELIELRAEAAPLPDFQLPEAAGWSPDEAAANLEAVTDFSRVIQSVGDPAAHAWRGSTLEQILPLDLERLLTTVPQRIRELDDLQEAATKLSQRLNDDPPVSLSMISRLLRTVAALDKAPELDPQPMAGMVWADHRQAIKELADHARSILEARTKLNGKVTETAWKADLTADCQAYAMHGRCWTRMFHAAYRKARRTLRSLLVIPQPGTFEERLSILELLNRHRTAATRFAESESFGAKVFGRYWAGVQTDLQRIVAWEGWDDVSVKSGISPRFRAMLSLSGGKEELRLQAAEVTRKLEIFVIGLRALGETLRLNFAEAFSAAADQQQQNLREQSAAGSEKPATSKSGPETVLTLIGDTTIAELRNRLVCWLQDPEGLQLWQIYRRSRAAASRFGNGILVRQIVSGLVSPKDGPAVFRFARAESLLRAILKKHPELDQFDGSKFDELTDEFCRLDIRRLELARAEVAAAHWTGIGRPRPGNMSEAVQLLRHEMQKQRRHLPLRELLSRAGIAVQAVKPVFMMSPLSVAQYLEPGALEFDMLLIDEASQVRPVEALGAAARCRQIVVVGDDKQMPPTQFFGRVLGDIPDERGTPSMQAGDVESILGLAIARNMPQRMLRWHYRSRHQSLIAVSNREFYGNQLYVVPSPERSGDLGVKWRFVKDGQFLKGCNEPEARVVAEAILRHARERPKWTLGVAAFSVSQRDAILNELNRLRKNAPDLEAFFDPNAPDPFFVKNLENVQGDERDAVFVSVGYGPGEDGKILLNFGPVSAAGGERRLNVLMTRAKRVLEIFSSMRADDIDLTRATGKGPAVFREYLRFAESGGDEDTTASGNTRDRFVRTMARQLRERGYAVSLAVGTAGLYVDLAVIDPDDPRRYLLGVIVDGEGFGSARSSRDRNRTTDGVLCAQGWLLLHLWSLDWFRRPAEQLNRLVEAIESARAGRTKPKEARLASSTSEVLRQTGSPDPLAVAVTGIESPSRSAPNVSAPSGTSEVLSDLLTKGIQAGVAVLAAEKGKGLEAAINELNKGPDTAAEKSYRDSGN